MASLGQSVCILAVRRDGALESGCLALVRRGRLSRSLEITSLPSLGPDTEQAFWTGLREACATLRITELGVYSFGASMASIPSVGVEPRALAARNSFSTWMEPIRPKLDKTPAKSEEGAAVKSCGSVIDRRAALDEHVRLMTLLERHANKGETIGDGGDPAMPCALGERVG
jgi:hypothetical protein